MRRLEWDGLRTGGNACGHIEGQIRSQESRVEKGKEKEKGIRIATLKIRSGRAGGWRRSCTPYSRVMSTSGYCRRHS